ncbi:hypothetical protein F3Y22_tig00004355pilonHSYRG00073 [Hibiscus syriacus]|uniref:Uncharacterized protein n=1 Tax=Hibiscus syriacus TaxID=106335 RepID=A0A6A3CMM4_HIBSY|nr:hypothetical protein F3Y22_tig00004355pilonHSYRG00073 [Hibiscus syriacus]
MKKMTTMRRRRSRKEMMWNSPWMKRTVWMREDLTIKKKKNNKNVSKRGLRKGVLQRKKSAVAKKPLKKGKERTHERSQPIVWKYKTSLRSSSSKTIQEVEELGQCKKPPGRKGRRRSGRKWSLVVICAIKGLKQSLTPIVGLGRKYLKAIVTVVVADPLLLGLLVPMFKIPFWIRGHKQFVQFKLSTIVNRGEVLDPIEYLHSYAIPSSSNSDGKTMVTPPDQNLRFHEQDDLMPVEGLRMIPVLHCNSNAILSVQQWLKHRSRCLWFIFFPSKQGQFFHAKEQFQVMVRSQLKAMSNNTDLDIATSSVQTILAACVLEHRRSEVHMVPLPSNCTHLKVW